jgi:hypothetical protein
MQFPVCSRRQHELPHPTHPLEPSGRAAENISTCRKLYYLININVILTCNSLYIPDDSMNFLIRHILQLPAEQQQPADHISLNPPSPTTPHYDDSDEDDRAPRPPTKTNNTCCS